MPQSLRLCFLHPHVTIIISSSVTFLVPKKYPYALSSPKFDTLLWDLSSDIFFEGKSGDGARKGVPSRHEDVLTPYSPGMPEEHKL